MPEFSRPKAYIDKLRFAERTVKAASFRHDQRQALRELCEGMAELIVALIEREEAQTPQGPAQPPTSDTAVSS